MTTRRLVNLHIYPSPFKHESRILKETQTLAKLDHIQRIDIAATWEVGLAEYEQLDEKRHVWRIKAPLAARKSFWAKVFNIAIWQVLVFLKFRKQAWLVNCHSLAILPLGWVFSVLTGAIIVYDTHELETETIGSVGIRRQLARLIEQLFIRTSSIVLTVNHSIANWYRKTYRLQQVYAVRNIPYRQIDFMWWEKSIQARKEIRSQFGLTDDDILFLYLGGLFHGRGVEIILDAFVHTQPNKHVIFIGYGELAEKIKSYSAANSNIHLHPAVRPEDVPQYTCVADVGISLGENACLSYYLSLPNKLFEYISCGLPVIASNFPEMKQIIEGADCGWTIDVEQAALQTLLNNLTKDNIKAKTQNTREYSRTIGWQDEEKVMLNAYQSIWQRGGQI